MGSRAYRALLVGMLSSGVALAAGEARSATVTIAEGSLVGAYTESGSDTVYPTIVSTGAAVYSFPGAASAASTGYDVGDPDAGIGIDFHHTHAPAGAYGPFFVVPCDPFCSGSSVTLRLQTASPVHYLLTAWYAATDEHGRDLSLAVELLDLTMGVTLFAYDEIRSGLPHASFDTGSIGGTLVPGHEYQLTLAADLRSDATATGPASAQGTVSLAFTLVPEAGTAILTGLGLAGLAIAGRTARRR